MRAEPPTSHDDLRKQGYRITPQRERILKIFEELPEGSHLSAEELHQRLGQEAPRISLATTYRTLKLLASLGLVREVDFAEGHKHYELRREDAHQHMICVGCGATAEVEGEPLEAAGREVVRRHGFLVHEVQAKILGLCASCQGRRAP